MAPFMFKLRRYRVFLLFSAFAIALWYHYSPPDHDGTFAPSDEWLKPSHHRGTTKEKIKSEWSPPDPDDAMPPSKGNPHGTDGEDADTPDVPALTRKPSFATGNTRVAEAETPVESTAIDEDSDDTHANVPLRPGSMHEHSGSRAPLFDSTPIPDNVPGFGFASDTNRPHWKKMPEHFPLLEKDIIKLPQGAPKKLRKIQYDFSKVKENDIRRKERLQRQAAVKDAFKHAWEGYRTLAWGHDEVTPVSGGFKDPFAGWAATLVDALDTMAIMKLHTEFEEALAAVAKIDFTTTSRQDIPMFETTIRYLGGLIGAYDVSGQKHQILIDKAEELAEILYNAFDTPNRMPVLYFMWQPEEVEKKHRASKMSCMAELGSLSVEFTRLAQITGKHKYFDAIQRITNEFDKFLNKTTLPGFWPLIVDASGCEMVDEVYTVTLTTYPTPTPETQINDGRYSNPARNRDYNAVDAAIQAKIAKSLEAQDAREKGTQNRYAEQEEVEEAPKDYTGGTEQHSRNDEFNKRSIVKRDADLRSELAEMERQAEVPLTDGEQEETDEVPARPAHLKKPPKSKPVLKEQIMTKSKCVPSGFLMNAGQNKYSYGGMSDSTYEYLLKEYILLGGTMDQYGDLYLKTFETGRDNLFFKPMTPQMDDILVSGDMTVNYDFDQDKLMKKHEGDGSHLTCFVGGMVGMGAKIFDRPEDLELAIKLTDGCVWNYFSTETGIMPEGFSMAACPKTGTCEWDENKWKSHLLAPSREAIDAAKERGISIENPYARHRFDMKKRAVGYSGGEEKTGLGYDGSGGKGTVVGGKDMPPPPLPETKTGKSRYDVEEGVGVFEVEDEPGPTRVRTQEEIEAEKAPKPDAYETWQDSVKAYLKYNNIPRGYTTVPDPRYILRPEAIESVWYMYRITGDRTWQDKGWRMFQAVEKYTKTKFAHSAISSVIDAKSASHLDSMESFWLAETLKYFYLLFSEPDLISLDDWVLNTEAHPLRRPKP